MDEDYALRFLMNAVRVEKSIVEDFKESKMKYHQDAVKLAKKHIPSLEKAIVKLLSK